MRWFVLITCAGLMGCEAMPQGTAPADTRAILSTRDIAMNRPNTDTKEAMFRMLPDGTGTVEFLAHPDGAQDVDWTLDGNRFCIEAVEGLMATFDCATLSVDGSKVTMAHIGSDSTVTGEFVPR